jgi:hypothetical protein
VEREEAMNCRDFRNHHAAFIDNTLAHTELVAMHTHLAICEACVRYNTAMRRGLMVLRNLPSIEPSPDFFDRLSTRISQVKEADARAALYRGPSVGSFFIATVGVVAAGFLAAIMFHWNAPTQEIRLAPVVAMHPAPAPVVSSGFMVSASAGMPVWPAAMMAEQAPVHFMNAELQLSGR